MKVSLNIHNSNNINVTKINKTKISFNGYDNVLKTMWKNGQLPRVKNGLYGEKLTLDNLSVEHLVPVSKGGSLLLKNTALASKTFNSHRGNRDLKEVLTRKQAFAWIDQFFGDNRPIIKKYLEGFYKTLRNLDIL